MPDETYEHFLGNGVEKSLLKGMLTPLKSPFNFLETLFRGYVPMTLSPSKLSTLPVDILIDKNGKIVKAHYCKDTVSNLSSDTMIEFAQGD